MFIYCFHICYRQLRREGDSNPRYPLGVYTLSRRASSTTRASLLMQYIFSQIGCKLQKNCEPPAFSATNVFFFLFSHRILRL